MVLVLNNLLSLVVAHLFRHQLGNKSHGLRQFLDEKVHQVIFIIIGMAMMLTMTMLFIQRIFQLIIPTPPHESRELT